MFGPGGGDRAPGLCVILGTLGVEGEVWEGGADRAPGLCVILGTLGVEGEVWEGGADRAPGVCVILGTCPGEPGSGVTAVWSLSQPVSRPGRPHLLLGTTLIQPAQRRRPASRSAGTRGSPAARPRSRRSACSGWWAA